MPKCLKYLSAGPVRTAHLCFWCSGVSEAQAEAQILEDRGYQVTLGICPGCLDRFGADSLRGRAEWALPSSSSLPFSPPQQQLALV